MSSLPLEKVKVLDLSNLLAGPMLAMYLADFGADVIKVEQPSGGDEMRRWGRSKNGVGLFYKMINRNKKCVTLNLRSPKGQEIVRRLVAEVDVVVENFRPGRMEKWGLGYDTLRAINPGLVMVRVSGYGQSGPYSTRPGFGTIAEALSGCAAITGYSDDNPLLPSFGLGDGSAAIFGAFGTMLALFNRANNGGKGQVVDVSLYEGLFTLLGPQVVDFDQLGVLQRRNGSRLPFVAPRNTFRTSDERWIAIAGSTQTTFERMARALGLDDMLSDPKFASNEQRITNCEELDERIQERIAHMSYAEAMQALVSSEAPAGPVNDVENFLDDPHFQARENVVSVDDDELGPIRMQNVVPKLTGTPGKVKWAGGKIGQFNKEIYAGLLKMSASEIGDLRQQGII
jgi:crotonobetainyl-CoA:carnitine CoA-transferase CaiB-like acyl-CoA transferase